jgi:hypothetical protein
MAYVRSRTTKTGTLSTALVEAYRDKQGQPRQRLLANLHGEPTALKALAKLIVRKDVLCAELDELAEEHRQANDPKRRYELGDRILQIDGQLKVIAKDGDAINSHCTITPDELEAAAQAHAEEVGNAFNEVLGRSFMHHLELKQAKTKLRRLRS